MKQSDTVTSGRRRKIEKRKKKKEKRKKKKKEKTFFHQVTENQASDVWVLDRTFRDLRFRGKKLSQLSHVNTVQVDLDFSLNLLIVCR